jgi:hypothetical protein
MQVLTSECVTGAEVSVRVSSTRFGARQAPSSRHNATQGGAGAPMLRNAPATSVCQ